MNTKNGWTPGPATAEVHRMLKAGMGVRQIADARRTSTQAVYKHIGKLVDHGVKIPARSA